MQEHRITVRLSGGLRHRLEAAAANTGKRESELVREALENQLPAAAPEPTAYDLARRAGIIGVVRNADPGLSVNPKHFDGFGES